MTDHDWTGHHDGPDDGHDDLGHHDPHLDPHLDAAAEAHLDDPADDRWHTVDDPDGDHPHEHSGWEPDDHDHPPADDSFPAGHAGDDPVHDDAEPPAHEAAAEDVFPPMLEVGPLPEPVDGFPWIDTGSLGLSHAGIVDQAMLDRMPAQDPAELAAYAAEDLPPGADPWAHLAGSEDPATAALAEFYRPGDTDA